MIVDPVEFRCNDAIFGIVRTSVVSSVVEMRISNTPCFLASLLGRCGDQLSASLMST